MAAVSATISSRLRAISINSFENTEVQLVAVVLTGSPVSGSITPTEWNLSASFCSAGVWPRPFSVIA